MGFHFATCQRHRAMEFLQDLYPNQIISDTAGNAKELLDFVEKDIVRIQDPKMHKPAQIIPGKNWDEEHREAVRQSGMQLNDAPPKLK